MFFSMKYLYQYFLYLLFTLVMGCSSSPDSFVGDRDTTAIETCYDVQLSNAGLVQNTTLCTTRENGTFNGLGYARFLRFSVDAFATVSLRVTRVSGLNPADPDIALYKKGEQLDEAESIAFNVETLTTNLSAGNYVFVIQEYTYSLPAEKQQVNFSSPQKTSVTNTTLQATSASNCTRGDDSTVRGNITFARVNHFGSRLDYTNITNEAVQQALVEVICVDLNGNEGAYSSTVTDSGGAYTLNFPNNQNSFVRVHAQMINADNWDFSVVDNGENSQPVYAMDGAVFNANTNLIRNLLADSGWDNDLSRYVGPRVAAPFAILDSVRKAKDKILTVANVKFPPLKINWNPNNSSLTDTGSFYNSSDIFISGKANFDTDEYDEHVIIHEWGHYFEDKFSRSDSVGGPHGDGDILDIRVAFGEGFGNAFSAIVLDNPFYVDSVGNLQNNGFSINMESNQCNNEGWYSECSVQSILYDIYDTNDDSPDTLSLDFSFIYNVLISAQRDTEALTSIFSFIKPFKDQNPTYANAVDAILRGQNIDGVSDIYGSGQRAANPGITDQLPVYEPF